MNGPTEFYCGKAGGGCRKYFDVVLKESMHGNYIIVCPCCKHSHFRFLDLGQVTSDRYDEQYGEPITLHGISTSTRDKSIEYQRCYRTC